MSLLDRRLKLTKTGTLDRALANDLICEYHSDDKTV